jgi:hypothetical protein
VRRRKECRERERERGEGEKRGRSREAEREIAMLRHPRKREPHITVAWRRTVIVGKHCEWFGDTRLSPQHPIRQTERERGERRRERGREEAIGVRTCWDVCHQAKGSGERW